MRCFNRPKILFLALALSLSAASTWAQPLYSSWAYGRDIHLNTTSTGANTSTSVTNFPVLVRLDAGNFNFAQAASDGSDIRFENSSQTGALSYQIERWDAGIEKAEIWVLIPTVQYNNNTQFFRMFWGKSGQSSQSSGSSVFPTGNGFGGVWHLNEDGSATAGAYLDATANANSGTGTAMTSASDVNGADGIGSNFMSSSDQYISIPHASTLHSSGSLTVEAWVNPASLGVSRRILSKAYSSGAAPWNEYSLETDFTTGDKVDFSLSLGGTEVGILSTTSLSIGGWYHVVGVWDGSYQRIYVNGVEEANQSRTGSAADYGMPLLIGKWSHGAAENWDGKIDEPRVSTTVRSASWIKLAFENQKAGQTLVVMGPKVWDGGGADNNWSTAGNWSDDAPPGTGDDVLFDGTSSKNCNLDASRLIHSITFTSGNAGIFDFGSSTLSLDGNADFRTGGVISANAGTLVFTGATNHTLTPHASYALPGIIKNGNGSVTVATNPVNAAGLSLNGGTWNWGSGSLMHSLSAMTATGGAMTFGSNTVDLTGDADFSGLTALNANSGTLEFQGSANKILTPKSGAAHPHIKITGNGSVTLAGSGLTTANVEITSGVLDISANSKSLALTGNLLINGGTLAATNGSIDVDGNVTLSSGTLTCPAGNFNIAGSLVSSGGSFTHNSGTVIFDGTAAGKTIDNASGFGNLTLNGSSGAWTAASHLTVAGTFNLAAGGLDIAANVKTLTAGTYTQGGGTLTANSGDVDANGNFTQSGGTFTAPGSVRQFTVAGSFSQTGGTFTTGSGKVTFDGTGTGKTLNCLATLNAADFTGTGEWTVTGNPLNVGNLSMSAAVLKMGSAMTHAVTGSLTLTGGTWDFGSSTVQIHSSTVNMNGLGTVTPGTGTLEFMNSGAKTFTPKSGATHPGLKLTGSGAVTLATYGLNTGKVDVNAGTLDLSSFTLSSNGDLTLAGGTVTATNGNLTVIGNLTVTSGTLNCPSGNLSVTGNVAKASGATWNHGSGTLILNGGSTGKTLDIASATLNHLTVNGSGGGWTVTNSGLAISGTLTVTLGTLALGSAPTTTVAAIATGGGTLNLGSSTLQVTSGNADFSGLGTLTVGSGTLAFSGSSAQTFIPKNGATLLALSHLGSGTTTVSTYPLYAGTLSITGGSMDMGSGLTHSLGTITGNGGFTLGSSTLFVSGNLDFTGLGTCSTASGNLVFSGASAQTFKPQNGQSFANITQTGSGTTTLSTNGVTVVTTLSVSAGTFNLGSGLTHTIQNFSASGGGLDFGSSTLKVTNNPDFSSLATLTPGTGILQFSYPTGGSTFTPKSGATHPAIVHDGGATVTLATNDLSCISIDQSAGSLDLNGRNVTTTGNFTVSNGTGSSFSGLAARTITVGGNAVWSGTSVSSKLVLNPASNWTLAVTGALSGTFLDLGKSQATVSTGACSNCGNGGGNTGWAINITWDGGGSDNNWTTAANWGSDAVPAAGDNITFNSTSVKNTVLDASATIGSILFTSGFTGDFSFGAAGLTVSSGNADFRSGGTFTAGSGSLSFTSSSAQVCYPHASSALPGIVQNGAGGTTLSTNGLIAGNLTLTSGTLNLGSALTHNVGGVSGAGGINFGSSTLRATGNVDFSSLATFSASSGSLIFTGSSAQTFTPKTSSTIQTVQQYGAGGTSLSGTGFTAATLDIANGGFAIGSQIIQVSQLSGTGGGALNMGSGTIKMSGVCQLGSLGTLTPGTGTLEFNGGSSQNFTPKASTTHPSIVVSSSGGGVVLVANGLNTPSLTLNSGFLNLGSGLVHTVAGLTLSSGTLDFATATLRTTATTVDLSTLSTLNPATGSLEFTAASGTQIFIPNTNSSNPNLIHSGAGTLRFSSNNVVCLSFTNSAGSVDFNGRNLTTSSGGNLAFSNGANNTMANLGGRTLTVAGSASFAGANGTLINMDPGSAWTLAVTGTLSASRINLAQCNASVTAGTASNSADGGGNTAWSFSETWTGAGSDNYWSTGANWGSGIAPGATIAITFDNTSVKNATLGAGASAKSITFNSGYTGTFDFGSNTLTINSGNADFRSGGAFTAGTGTLAFVGTSGTQTFIPKSGATFPDIVQNGAGTTLVSTNGLTAGNLTLSAGLFNLGSGLGHSFKAISGSGALNLGTSDVQASGNVDFSGLSAYTESAGHTLTFTGSGSQSYTGNASASALLLTHTGSGTLTFAANVITASLGNSAGTLNLGLSRTHSVAALAFTGGALNFSSSGLQVSGAAADFSGLASVSAGSGHLDFTGTAAQTFTPRASAAFPDLIQNGSGGTTVAGSLAAAGSLTVVAGAFSLGNGFTHSISAFAAGGGSLAFGSSTLQVTTGNADFSSLTAVTAGTGALVFNSSSGTQVFTPKSGSSFPALSHTSAGTLRLAGSAPAAASLSLTDGSFDLNGLNLTVTGNLTVTTGGASLLNLGGRTLTVGGNASLTGQASNLLALNPASAWTLAATGTLTATYANLANCAATVSSGMASNTADQGANTGWTFAVAWTGGGNDNNWSTGANWGSGAMPNAATDVAFDASSAKNLYLDQAATVKSITLAPAYTGLFDFGGQTLSIHRNADFRSGGTFAFGLSGEIDMIGSASQNLYPHATQGLPAIRQNGSGGTTVLANGLKAGNLTINSGSLNLGAGLTHSAAGLSGSGSLDFSSSTLRVTGNADFTSLSGMTPGTGELDFTGTSPQIFLPGSFGTFPALRQNGSGGTTVSNTAFSTPALYIDNGTFNLGNSGLAHTVATTFTATGGGLDFNLCTLKVAAAAVDLNPLATLAAGSGTLELIGPAGQTLSAKTGATHPGLKRNGSGIASLATRGWNGGILTIYSGTLDLGTGLSHAFASIASPNTGTLQFNSSAVTVAGNADFGGLTLVTSAAGSTLSFTAASGSQTFTPETGSAFPVIQHTGAGTLFLSANDLDCAGLIQTTGSLDFNGRNVTIASGGVFHVMNGIPTSLAGLGGRLITVGGNVTLRGQPGSHLGLNPAFSWTLAVSGTLKASNVDLGKCQASVSGGLADSSINKGGNANWTFLDTVPPANVPAFTATALAGHTVELAWNAPADPDVDSISLRYRTDGVYPVSRTDGTLWRVVPKSRGNDTASGLADKTVFQFAAFVKDSAGNWSGSSTAARDTARTPDVTPPADVTALSATAISASSLALAWTPSASADADSVMIRYRTGTAGTAFPLSNTDGVVWRTLPTARAADTITGISINLIYSVGLFVRDSSGNWCNRSVAAQDSAVWVTPVTGSVAFADFAGFTSSTLPRLNLSGANADSVRFSLLPDTSAAVWRGYHTLDSLDIAGADGARIAAAQFKNQLGTRSPWYRDTTRLDRSAPAVTLNLPANAGYLTWAGLVQGKALDGLAGTDTVFILRQRVADGKFFNGTAWGAPDTARLRADSTFSVPMAAASLTSGSYDFSAWAKDKLGNVSAPQTRRVLYDTNRAPAVAASDITDSVLQNQAVAWKLDLGDMDLGDTVKPIAATVPPWLAKTESSDTARGGFTSHRVYALSGRPGQAEVGQQTLSVQVRDVGGQVFTFTKSITVLDVNDAPVFAAGQDSAGVKEDSLTRRVVHFSDPDPSDKPVLTLVSAPSWVSLADSTLTFGPGSRHVGPAQVRLFVGDGKLLDTLDIAVNVINVNDAPVAFPGGAWDSVMHWSERGVDSFTVVVVDMDKNDAVNLATALPDFISVKNTLDSSGYNRYFRFTVRPAQKDAGSYSLKLKFLDAAGTSGSVSLRAVVAAVNDVPIAAIQSIETSAGAARAALDVVDADGSLSLTRFHYRVVNASGDTVRSGICPAPPLYLYPLADGEYRLAIRAEDEGGLKQSAYAISNFTINGASALALDSARWNMLGYPGRALAASALGAGAAAATWDEAASDGSPLGRYTTGKSADSLLRGKGYWIKTARRATLTVPQADLLDKPFVVKLARGKQGWNQIGNPYPFYLDLSATGFTFWGWDADKRDLVDAKGLLKPWGAYWVQVGRDTALTLKGEPWFPASGKGAGALAKGAGASDAPGFRHAGDWSLQLSLTAGPYRDQANFLGIRPVTPAAGSSASAGADIATDAPGLLADAPKFGDYIALHFEKAAAAEIGEAAAIGYAADFRASLGGDEAWWDFSVENSASGQTQAALSLPGLADLGRAGLYAFLVRAGSAAPLTADAPALLAMDGSATHYSIVVTPHADFAARLKGEFSISQNFPNPVVAQTSFRFYLPQAWGADDKRLDKAYRLRLNVYDFSGRLAARVAEGAFRPGSHTLLWKPQGLGGSGLAKGAYVYRLEIPGMAKTMKLIIK